MRVAALDLGSNTFLLLVAEVVAGQIEKVILDETRVVRLGQGLQQNKKFHPDALARAELCLAEFSGLIKKNQVEVTVAVATSAARDAENGQLLIDMGHKYQIPIQIIDGIREAEITFAGAVGKVALNSRPRVIDVGGGSTEVIGIDDTNQVTGTSIDVGSVRLTEMFLPNHPCSKEDLSQLESYIREQIELKRALLPLNGGPVVAVAGTPTSLAMLEQRCEFSEKRIQDYILSTELLWRWRNLLAGMSVVERQALPGMQPQRADVLVAGTTILAMVAEALGVKQVSVSIKGVRYGVAQSWEKLKL